MEITQEHREQLKAAGFQHYEISHFVARRFNKISKTKVGQMWQIVRPPKPNKIMVIRRPDKTIVIFFKNKIKEEANG